MITTQIVDGGVCAHCGASPQYGVRLVIPWDPAFLDVGSWYDPTWAVSALSGREQVVCVICIACLPTVAPVLGVSESTVHGILQRYHVVNACHTVHQYIRADARTTHDVLQAFVRGTIAEHAFGQALLVCGVSRDCLAQWTRDAAADPHGFWGSVQGTLCRMSDRLVYVHTRSYITST